MRSRAIAVLCVLAVSCIKFSDENKPPKPPAPQPLPTIRLKGSDAMRDLTTRLAALYKSAHVIVEGGGTASGFGALAARTADVAVASSRMDEDSWVNIEQKRHAHIIETPIGYSVVALYVNNANPVTQLSLAQVGQIMSGSTTNWQRVGGPNAPIHVYGEASVSGFTSYLGQGDIAAKPLRAFGDTPGTIAAVAGDPSAVGFAHPAPASQARIVRIAKDHGSPAAAPLDSTVLNGTYPLAGEVFFYTFDTSPVAVKKFVAWTRSSAAAKAFVTAGYAQLGG